jgi:hypothetical protein
MEYPGDDFFRSTVGKTFAADYEEAGQELNDGYAVWTARAVWDIARRAYSPNQSINRHRDELRTTLGLPTTNKLLISTPKLHVDGLQFKTLDGSPWIMRFSSEFTALARLLRGEKQWISDIFGQRNELGCNGARIFLEVPSWGGDLALDPQTHSDYYDKLPILAQILKDQGMYGEFTIFTDDAIIHDKQTHVARIYNILKGYDNILIEFANEKHVSAENFSKPDDFCTSSGSGLGDDNPPKPFWDYCGFHPRRDDPKVWVSSSDVFFAINGWSEGGVTWEGTKRATVINEPIGADINNQPGRRSNNPTLFAAIGQSSRTFGAGGCFHSTEGIWTLPFSDVVKNCAIAYFNVGD